MAQAELRALEEAAVQLLDVPMEAREGGELAMEARGDGGWGNEHMAKSNRSRPYRNTRPQHPHNQPPTTNDHHHYTMNDQTHLLKCMRTPRITSRVASSDLQGKASSSWMTVPSAGSMTPSVNLADFFTLGRFSSRKF